MSSKTRVITSDDKALQSVLANLPTGEYLIEYNDATHTSDLWIPLLKADVQKVGSDVLNYTATVDVSSFYAIRPAIDLSPLKYQQEDKQRECERTIRDQLALCFCRLGYLSPEISAADLRTVVELGKRDCLVILPDTNALSNGTLHWAMQAFRHVSVSILPVAISMVHIQQHETRLKSLVRKPKANNLSQALRSRTLVNASLALLGKYRERYQVLEIDPQLLRYVRSAATDGEDQSDIMEDRLFVEAIHQIFRTARSHTEKRVMTSDVLLGRILSSEAIPSLSVMPPVLPNDFRIDCIRYDGFAKRFLGAPLQLLLWDLAQTFASVRLKDQTGQEIVRLETYWPGKHVHHWDDERLTTNLADIETDGSQATPAASASLIPQPTIHFSNFAAPNVSFLPIIKLASVLREPAPNLEAVVGRFPRGERPSPAMAENAAEVLLQSGFIEYEEEGITPTNRLDAFRSVLSVPNVGASELDEASRLFESFKPYSVCLEILRTEGALPAELTEELKDRFGKSSIFAYKRLKQFPIHLGQAYTGAGEVRDGSCRPSDEKFRKEFDTAFDATQSHHLVSIEKLIADLSSRLRMSPIALIFQLERLANSGSLPSYRFDPASGITPIFGDTVLSGTLEQPALTAITVNRILVGGRPVFTIARRK